MKQLLQTLFFFLLVTQICFAQWVPIGLGDKGITEIAVRNLNIFAITTDSILYRSTDNGINWSQIVDSDAVDIAISPTGSLFLVAEDSLYKSSDNGNTWVNLSIMEQLPSLLGHWPINVTLSPIGFVFCGILGPINAACYATNLALSTDDGSDWSSPGATMYGGGLFDIRGQYVINSGFACRNRYMYLSTDNGQNWSDLGAGNWYGLNWFSVLSMCLNGNIIIGGYVGYEPGLFLSSDSCNTWTKVSQLFPEAGLTIESGGVLVGSDTLGVFLFSDDGDSIGSRNDGLSNLNIHTFTMDNNGYVYIGTDNGVWRRPLSEIVTSVENETTHPSYFFLSQNFPNPFNPSTKIKYSVPQTSQVQIKVFDVLGNEIETLVNEEKPAGTYGLTWNAESLPSGVYFYQLKAGDFIQVKKMMLLK